MEGGEGVCPQPRPGARWLARASAPFPGGNPGRVVAAAAYVSAVSRRGRAGRPGGRERSLGGRAAVAEPGGGPRRVGGRRGSRSGLPSRAVRAVAARPAPPLVAGRGKLHGDLAALQPRDEGGPGTSHAPHALGSRAGSWRAREAGAAGAAAGRVAGALRQRPRRPGGGGLPLSLPCAALFISPAAGARLVIPSPTLSAGPESPLCRRVTCPLPDPFRPGRWPSPFGAPRVPARSSERPGGQVPGAGTRGATHPPPRGAGPHPPVPVSPPSTLLRAFTLPLFSGGPGLPRRWHCGHVGCPGGGPNGEFVMCKQFQRQYFLPCLGVQGSALSL